MKKTGVPLSVQMDMDAVHKLLGSVMIGGKGRERLEFLVNLSDAMSAFWYAFSEKYPQVKSGDLSPEDTLRFEEACRAAAEAWLMANMPSKL